MIAISLFACDDGDSDFNPEEFNEQVILDLVNLKRTEGCNCGTTAYPPVGEVGWNDTLAYVARDYSIKMKTGNFIDYTLKDSREIGPKLTEQDYLYSNFLTAVTKNYVTEKDIVNYLFSINSYCKSLMNADVEEIGIAVSGQYSTTVLTSK